MNTKAIWWLVGAVLLAGCVPSLNPIYTKKDLVFNEDVIGVWTNGKSTETWDFQRNDEKSYRLVFTDAQGQEGRFVCHLADIAGTKFLDIYPAAREEATPGFYRIHQVPIHTIYLVKEADEMVVLSAMDYTWLENYLNAHPDEVPSATFGSRRMLTASTEQLQQFLVNNKEQFKHDVILVRQVEVVEN